MVSVTHLLSHWFIHMCGHLATTPATLFDARFFQGSWQMSLSSLTFPRMSLWNYFDWFFFLWILFLFFRWQPEENCSFFCGAHIKPLGTSENRYWLGFLQFIEEEFIFWIKVPWNMFICFVQTYYICLYIYMIVSTCSFIHVLLVFYCTFKKHLKQLYCLMPS